MDYTTKTNITASFLWDFPRRSNQSGFALIMSILSTHERKCAEFWLFQSFLGHICSGCSGMCEEEEGKKSGDENYHLDRQRRDSTLLGRIINRLSHWEFSKQLTHFMRHALTCNMSAFTKIFHHPSALSRFSTQTCDRIRIPLAFCNFPA